MGKLIWLSDLHLTDKKDCHQRLGLEKTLAEVQRQHGDALACVITGDLVQNGTVEEYLALSEVFEGFTLPIWPVIGNHDRREAFVSKIKLPQVPMERFAQYVIETESHTLLFLDTNIPGDDSGEMCRERLDWLEHQLQNGHKPALIFMHHPPAVSGLGILDPIGFKSDKALAELIHGSRVCQIFAGHIHTSLQTVFAGLPVSTIRSLQFNFSYPVTFTDWDQVIDCGDRPQFGLIRLESGQHFVHTFDLKDVS